MRGFLFTLTLGIATCGTPASAAVAVDFDRDIRPILSDRCYACHGPDANAREADLRLDTVEGALGDHDGMVAFRAGDPSNSEAIHRIFSEDPDERMPPEGSKLALTDHEKGLLRRWVLEGATWSRHWAFEKPTLPPLPPVVTTAWPRNGIDRFVLAQLEQQGLLPASEASREMLIRRVTLDLTGLPPTPAEVDAFLKDPAADAYEKVVDRLLASQRYGERMAWEWLDAARYADTNGFQGDPTRTMWPWRDWLVGALNGNLSFDQFTVEMLAGDLLPNATAAQVIASGFNRNHMFNGEGGRIPEETRVENVFDRTETTSTVWLGLTMTCARCHDHKFDPISQREYYELYAFFNNTSESGKGRSGGALPVVVYFTPEQQRKRNLLNAQLAELRLRLDAPMPEIDRAQQEWERQIARNRSERDITGTISLSKWSLVGPLPPPDGRIEATFDHQYGPELDVDLDRKFAADSIAWQTEQDFVDGTPHALSETPGATYLYRTIEAPSARMVELSFGSDDAIRVWCNGKEILANNLNRGVEPDQDKAKVDLREGTNELLIKIVNTGGPGGFYFRVVSESLDGLSPELLKIVLTDRSERSGEAASTIREYYRKTFSAAWQALEQEQSELQQQLGEVKGVDVMVMDELPADKRRTTTMLSRGLYNKPGEAVSEGTPAFLPPMPAEAPRNRLTLARWLVDSEQPLTARVTINRYWQMFFGIGLVETSEDFGRQSSRPLHPELLDWLAVRFVDGAWNVKQLHRLIVTSATYRQSSALSAQRSTLAEAGDLSLTDYNIDRKNRHLARSSRFRLPSWMLRDQALFLSGLLVQTAGGPPVKPYQPNGVWAEATFGKIRYRQDGGASLYRASLYTFWRRIVGPTMFFDGSKRQVCDVRPSRTNTPLHALTTLNEATFVEASRAMAQRIMQTVPGSAEQRIAHAFRMATARQPTTDEVALLKRRWSLVRGEFVEDAEQADKLLSIGEAPRDETLDPADHAALTVVCSLLLNLDEVLTRE